MSVDTQNTKQTGKFTFKVNNKELSTSSHRTQEHPLSSINYNEFLSSLEAQEDNQNNNNLPSVKSIKRAGRCLRRTEGDLKKAEEIVRLFRAAHQKPLDSICKIISRICSDININFEQVNRLKRLETIVDKLQRPSLSTGEENNSMCITRMHDIGGCRFIFDSLTDLKNLQYKLKEIFDGESGRLKLTHIKNYIETPKENDCGYRCLHLIFKYKNHSDKQFNIEAQLRTKEQHIWATAVEIIDVVANTKIKTSSHTQNETKTEKQINWERLLQISSDLIADKEIIGIGQISSLAKVKKVELRNELRGLAKKLNAVHLLESFNMANDQISESIISNNKSRNKWLVLAVNQNEREVIIKEEYTEKNIAIDNYRFLELTFSFIDGFNILLLSINSTSTLAETYPNYAGDCKQFVELLNSFIEYP